MIQFSGHVYPQDIDIKIIGLRPGEKLFEELLVGDNVTKTENLLIMCAEEKMIDWKILKPLLNDLNEASVNFESAKIRKLLIEIVPEFTPKAPIIN